MADCPYVWDSCSSYWLGLRPVSMSVNGEEVAMTNKATRADSPSLSSFLYDHRCCIPNVVRAGSRSPGCGSVGAFGGNRTRMKPHPTIVSVILLLLGGCLSLVGVVVLGMAIVVGFSISTDSRHPATPTLTQLLIDACAGSLLLAASGACFVSSLRQVARALESSHTPPPNKSLE